MFEDFLDSCSTDAPRPYPEGALADPLDSGPVDAGVQLERVPVDSRLALAEYLDERFEASGFRPKRDDVGLWAWVGCSFFREICTKKKARWTPGTIARWVPRSNDFRRYYRHLVAGPYLIYRACREQPQQAMAALCQKPGSPGDLVEQLASRQETITSPTVMQVASELFVDPAGKQNRRANSKKAGGARRYIAVLAQFDVTWDLSMLSPSALHELLPAEFKPPGN